MGRIIAKRIRGMNWMAKVSLILIFTLVFSTFMYQGWYKPKFSEAAPTANGRIVHSVNTATPTDKIYTASSNTFVAGSAMTAGAAAPTFIVNRSAPTRDESMAGFVTTTGVLHIYKRNGATWIEVTNTAAPGGWGVGTRPTVGGNGVNGRRFDIVYENTAGRAIVVYSNNTSGANELRYRIWDGTTSIWTVATSLDSARITGIPNYIKMASKPGSNEVAVTVADAAANTLLTTLIWDGVSAWGGEPTTSHTTAGTNQYVWYTTTVGDSDSFDMAYESVSGNLYVGWNSKTTTDQYHRRRVGATWDASSTAWASTRNGQTFFAVAEPNSNYILAGFDRVASTRTMVRVWNGSAYTANVTQVSANNTAPAVNKKFTTGAWLSNGGTTAAVVVWSSSVANSVYYNYSTNYGTSWAGGTAGYAWVPTGALAASGIKWVDLSVDPRSNNDTLMYTFSELNTTNKLWAKRLQFTGPATFTWTNADGGAAMTTALTNVTTQNFSFAYDRKDLTPPTAGTVTVSPDYISTYTSGSPTITTTFTDNETAVTTCDYTTDNGTNWFPGVVSGSSPNYTCTGSPIGLSGPLTINMRANSGGGTTTATALLGRTADAAGPTDGTLTAISGGSGGGVGISLSWTAASDGLSGLRATNTYDVRYLVGAVSPTCSTGTSIYTGTGASFVHDGLTANQQYSYSVCAYDNVNNVSVGATDSAVAKLASTIVSCAGCHGYGAITDGTPRNTPAGTFPGSHNKHVVQAGKVCNVCHVVPATETSVDYKHRNSNIQLKVGPTAIDGGYYDKNNSSSYDAPGDYTFAQTNAAPSLQVCRTTYCHSQGTSATSNLGETRLTVSAPLVNLNWGSAGACSSCHGNGPSYASGSPKANSHAKHTTQCSTCHNTTTTDSTSITGPIDHANKLYTIALGNGATIVSYTYAGTGGTCTTISCHYDGTARDASRVWGSGALPATYDCVNCHKVTQAITTGPLAGTAARRAVSLEFANTWSHKRSAVPTGTVTKYDCGVCHMEGSATTGVVDSAYHGDGYIQLRDPDSGLTINGVTWDGLTPGSYVSTGTPLTFARFSRNLSVALESDPNFLTIAAIQKNHCLACHDTNGAFNASARVTGGVALKPFNTTITGHVAPYDSNGNGNVVDVNKSFLTSNASYHPVRGKANNSYAQGSGMMIAPWGKTTTPPSITSWGYLISCWDCHALSTDSGTITKTVTAHGASATLRGGIRAAGTTAATNLCLNCHKTAYSDTVNGQHGTGSAFAVGNANMNSYMSNCSYCHAYGPADGANLATSTARPLRAEDVHGFNDRTAGTVGSVWGTSNVRPYAFIRNILTVWSPASAPEGTPTHTCTGGANGNPCNNNMSGQAFTPGGAY